MDQNADAAVTDRRQAEAELIGTLCYGLLRSFAAAARGTATAPDISLAEWQAGFAVDEFERYRVLRARLDEITEEPERAMAALRGPLDSFYEAAIAGDWLETHVFHFVGDTITTDFADILAPCLTGPTAEAVTRSLTGRTAQEAFALEQIASALEAEGGDAQARIQRYAGTMIGQALNRLRDALLSSNALEIVLGEGGVKPLVLELLARHRERLERLGLDSLDD